ncbi:hypothetical protein [Streptomyces aidingensis]|uniref:Tetratricopeptide repeat-containing protein n=1 Tax=Streptomyces aidingensis TaxID=910347 RepID=A0A1I1HAD8_9ACTN|nr:hypothetical protein [Streptomyces aidingensis]SFC18968.1 hypothetical protein SAMN05421773_102254 [Streptomyces aidingensis]
MTTSKGWPSPTAPSAPGSAGGGDSIEGIVAAGSLHLRGVTLAARARDAATTEHHLQHAKRLAGQLPPDEGDQYRHSLTFGPGNVALHEMAAQIELEKPRRAVGMAEVLSGELPTGLGPTRIGHLHIDAARAYLATGDRDEALRSLLRARVLMSLRRRSKPEPAWLAKWAGLHEG